MKHLITFLILIHLSFSISHSETWKSIGLDNLKVNCLLSTKYGILAGTEKGLYLFDELIQNDWVKVTTAPELNITDIVSADSNEIIISASGGSNSDGIYGGLPIIKGSPYYSFSLISYIDFPQSISYHSDTLIIGCLDKAYSAVRDFSIISIVPGIFFLPPEQINIPQNSFGIENPIISDIIYSYQKNNFLVAGYDQSPEPFEGSLLLGNSKEMTQLFNISTTSILETFNEITGQVIYIGGIDCLYQYYPFSVPENFIKINTPNDLKVNHISEILLSQIVIGGQGSLCISTNEGIFHSKNEANWKELGNIPTIPVMTISVLNNNGNENILYAATDKGVYKYSLYNTSVTSSKIKNLHNNFSIKENILFLTSKDIQTVKIYNLLGQLIHKYKFNNSDNIKIDLSNKYLPSNTYLLRVKTKNKILNFQFTINN